jgi:hypothetical protein
MKECCSEGKRHNEALAESLCHESTKHTEAPFDLGQPNVVAGQRSHKEAMARPQKILVKGWIVFHPHRCFSVRASALQIVSDECVEALGDSTAEATLSLELHLQGTGRRLCEFHRPHSLLQNLFSLNSDHF